MQKLKSSCKISLDEFLKKITSSHIERTEKSIIFFMCSISPSCKISELIQNSPASRIEVNIKTGDVRIWFYDYKPRKPDILIKGVCNAKKVCSSVSISKS